MLRKGTSMTIHGIGWIVLGVIMLLVGFQVITGLNANSLEPNTNRLKEGLASYNTQEVSLGNTENLPDSADRNLSAEKQFRGMMVFNMLSAANCRLPVLVNAQLNDKIPDDLELQDNLEVDEVDEPVMIRFFHNFTELDEQTNFQATCFGSDAIDLNPLDNVYNKINPLKSKTDPVNDMEGKFGSVEFTVDSTFVLNDGDYHNDVLKDSGYDNGYKSGEYQDPPGDNNYHGEKLMAAEFYPVIDVNGKEHPDFWGGRRFSVFLPNIEGLDQNSWDAKYHELYSDERYQDDNFYQGDGSQSIFEGSDFNQYTTGAYKTGLERLYYYRIRMVDVPVVIPSDFKPNEEDISEQNSGEEDRFERFVEEAQYVFCEGAEGVVQSNALHIDERADGINQEEVEGESIDDVSRYENGVFPKVELSNQYSCLNVNENGNNNDPEYTSFYSYDLGNNCDEIEKVKGKRDEVNIGGETLKCGLRQDRTEFEFGGNTVPLSYYRPALFSKTCKEANILEGYLESGEIVDKSNSNSLEISSSQDTTEESDWIEWNKGEREKLDIKFSPKSQEGRVDFKLIRSNGANTDLGYFRWKKPANGNSRMEFGTDEQNRVFNNDDQRDTTEFNYKVNYSDGKIEFYESAYFTEKKEIDVSRFERIRFVPSKVSNLDVEVEFTESSLEC